MYLCLNCSICLNESRDKRVVFVVEKSKDIILFEKMGIPGGKKTKTGYSTDNEILENIIETTKDQKMKLTKSKGGIVVKGIDDVAVRFSRCCNPVPGDEIVGFVTRGRGVSIHRTDCVNMEELLQDENRIIDVAWFDEETKGSYNSFNI